MTNPAANTPTTDTKDSEKRVRDAAAQLELDIAIITHEQSTRTAQEAADACGCDVAQIVKSMIFEDSGGALILILVSGQHNADLRAIETRKGLTLARANTRKVRSETGFAIGGVAPIGHINAMPIYMDETLLTWPVVWCAAGRPNNVFSVNPQALARAIGATIIRVTP